jgi:hypothetical protein
MTTPPLPSGFPTDTLELLKKCWTCGTGRDEDDDIEGGLHYLEAPPLRTKPEGLDVAGWAREVLAGSMSMGTLNDPPAQPGIDRDGWLSICDPCLGRDFPKHDIYLWLDWNDFENAVDVMGYMTSLAYSGDLFDGSTNPFIRDVMSLLTGQTERWMR